MRKLVISGLAVAIVLIAAAQERAQAQFDPLRALGGAIIIGSAAATLYGYYKGTGLLFRYFAGSSSPSCSPSDPNGQYDFAGTGPNTVGTITTIVKEAVSCDDGTAAMDVSQNIYGDTNSHLVPHSYLYSWTATHGICFGSGQPLAVAVGDCLEGGCTCQICGFDPPSPCFGE